MVKTYLRYVLRDAFGVVTSPEVNMALASPGAAAATHDGLAVTGALEAVVAWDVRRGVCTKALRPPPKPGSGSSATFDVAASVTVVAVGARAGAARSSTARSACAAGYSDGTVRLWDLTKDEMVVALTGHRKGVSAVCFDGDGARLASGGRDTDVVVWDLVAEAGLFRLRGHKDEVTAIRFLRTKHDAGPAGGGRAEHLITASKDTFLKVWDLATQHCVQTIVGHRAEVWSIDVSPAGDRVVSGSSDRMLRLWRVKGAADGEVDGGDDDDAEPAAAAAAAAGAGGAEAPPVPGVDLSVLEPMGSVARVATDRVATVAFRHDGALVACQSVGKALEVWRVRSEKEAKKRLARRQKRLREKAEKRRAEAAASGGSKPDATGAWADDAGEDEDGVSAASKRLIASDELEAVAVVRSTHKMRSFSFLPSRSAGDDGEAPAARVLVSLQNNMLETYEVDVASGSAAAPVAGKRGTTLALPGHRSAVRACALSSDDRLLLTTSKGQAKVWNAASRRCVRTMDSGFGLCCAFCPGDRFAVVGNKDGSLQLFDIASGDCLEQHDEAHDGALWSLAVRPDGRGMMTGGADKTVKFYDFDVAPLNEDEPEGPKRLALVHTRTLKMTDDVLSVTYSHTRRADKLLVAVALLDNTVKVFFEDSLKFFLSLYGHRLPAMSIDISSDDALLISASADKNVKVWGMDFGDCHKSIFAHDDSVMAVRFVPKTHYFFSAGKDRTIKYWDADRFEQILELDGHKGEVWCLAVTSSGDALLSGSHDRSIRVWARTEEPVFLEEERERRQEEMFESELRDPDRAAEDVTAGGGELVESGRAGRRNEASVRAADRLLEALGLAEGEVAAWTEYLEDRNSALSSLTPAQRAERTQAELAAARGEGDAVPPVVPQPTRNVMLLGKTPAMFVLQTLRQIKPSDMEEALLLLPFPGAVQLLSFLNLYLERGIGVELCAKATLFLVKVHRNQLSSSADPKIGGLMLALQRNLHGRLAEHRDRIGFNLAGLQFVLEAAEATTALEDDGAAGGAGGAGDDGDDGAASSRARKGRGRKRARLALF